MIDKEELEKTLEFIKERMKQDKAELKKCPKGKLICSNNGSYKKWYVSYGSKRQYIPKSNRKLAVKLANKRFLQDRFDSDLRIEEAIERFLKDLDRDERKRKDLRQYIELVEERFALDDYELEQWKNADYESLSAFSQDMIHTSLSGKMLRSKAESMIDSLLFFNKIPYRYECKLDLGDSVVYPDFTMVHPKKRKLIYWEHFGMMDNEDYARKAYDKLKLYIDNGIIPDVELIATFETKDNPLTFEVINKKIHELLI